MKAEIEIDEQIEASYEDRRITVERNGSEIVEELYHPKININVEDSCIQVSTESSKNNVKSLVKTYSSIIQNAVEGLEDHYEYELEAVYAHFPMSISQDGENVVIENFMGEKQPRKAKILEGVQVEVGDEELTVTGQNKQKVGQTAANIEQACKKGNRDPRTFQDGIYIVGDNR